MDLSPNDHSNLNEPEHQEPESSIKVICNLSFPLKSVLPFLQALAGLITGLMVGASSTGHLPLQNDVLNRQNSLPPAPQVQPQSQEDMR